MWNIHRDRKSGRQGDRETNHTKFYKIVKIKLEYNPTENSTEGVVTALKSTPKSRCLFQLFKRLSF